MFENVIEVESRIYKRERDLPKCLDVWEHEISDYSLEGTKNIIDRLSRKDRKLQILGCDGHWTYDFNGHAAVKAALKAERRFLREAR